MKNSVKNYETYFKLHFKPESLLQYKIKDAHQKFLNGDLGNFEEPTAHKFRDEWVDNNKSPYLVCFKLDTSD